MEHISSVAWYNLQLWRIRLDLTSVWNCGIPLKLTKLVLLKKNYTLPCRKFRKMDFCDNATKFLFHYNQWADVFITTFKTHSHWMKTKAKVKIFFDVCHLFWLVLWSFSHSHPLSFGVNSPLDLFPLKSRNIICILFDMTVHALTLFKTGWKSLW